MKSSPWLLFVAGCCLLGVFVSLNATPQSVYSHRATPLPIDTESYPYPLYLPYTLQRFYPNGTPIPPIALTNTPTASPTATTTPTVTPTALYAPTATPTAIPQGPAMTRFNFEVAGHVARDGYCTMHRSTGDLLLTWETEAGWQDSSNHPQANAQGWIPVHIPFVSIYVHVFCDDGTGPIKMDIYNGVTNPETGETVGWLTREVENAIEIGWP